jgi:hypothetical protein
LISEILIPKYFFDKWAAVEVAGFDNVPDAMETYILEAGLYAVFYTKELHPAGHRYSVVFSEPGCLLPFTIPIAVPILKYWARNIKTMTLNRKRKSGYQLNPKQICSSNNCIKNSDT